MEACRREDRGGGILQRRAGLEWFFKKLEFCSSQYSLAFLWHHFYAFPFGVRRVCLYVPCKSTRLDSNVHHLYWEKNKLIATPESSSIRAQSELFPLH